MIFKKKKKKKVKTQLPKSVSCQGVKKKLKKQCQIMKEK